MRHMTRARHGIDRWGAPAAAVAPILAFGIGGTAAPIGDAWETGLQVAVWPVAAVAALALGVNTRRARTISGAVIVAWWAGALYAITVAPEYLAPFGLFTVAAIPFLVATSWGKAWASEETDEHHTSRRQA